MLEETRYVTCPNCGKKLPIAKMSRLGRKPLNISVKKICDTLVVYRDIALAAKKLDCSRAYIYRELAKHATTPREVMQSK